MASASTPKVLTCVAAGLVSKETDVTAVSRTILVTENGVTRTPAVSSTKAVDNAFVKAVGQEMEQIALMLMNVSLLRTPVTWTPTALTPRDRFRAGADVVTEATVLRAFLMVPAKV